MSKDSSSNGRCSASAVTQSSSRPALSRARLAGLQQLGREVAGGDVRALAAAGIEALPVPAATSSTLTPAPIRQASTSRGPSGVRKVSTIDG